METIRIGNYDVSKDDVWLYIQHFGRDKSNLLQWEHMRKELHNNIFENLHLVRFSDGGNEFSEALDKWAEPHILKYDSTTSLVKTLGRVKTDKEIANVQMQLQIDMVRKRFMCKNGVREFSVEDKTTCRICGKDCIGIGRINDHLFTLTGLDTIHQPICMDCAENKPDEYHKAFKRIKK